MASSQRRDVAPNAAVDVARSARRKRHDTNQNRRYTAVSRGPIIAAVVISAVVQLQPNDAVVIELPHDDVLVDGSFPIVRFPDNSDGLACPEGRG
jgi:hypothetical protein